MGTDQLQIFIVTYNRLPCLRETISQLLAEDSPVRTCEIVVLDNRSTDGTAEFIKGVSKAHANVRLVTHPRNIGGNANICRAMELASRDYYWILGDDDFFHFENWNEVEAAMSRGEKAICLSRYILPDACRDDVARQLVQATFITGMIISTSLLNDTVMSESYNRIYTLFPQMTPVLSLVNGGGRIYVVRERIVDNGDQGSGRKDVGYTRGSDILEVAPYARKQVWITGWAAAIAALNDRGLRERALMAGASVILSALGDGRDAESVVLRLLRRDMGCRRLFPLPAFVFAVAPATLRRKIGLRLLLWLAIGLEDVWVLKRMIYRVGAFLLPWRRDSYRGKLSHYEDRVVR